MESEGKLRIGAVSYLNTKPLVYRLEQLAPDAEIVFDVPSRLADDLSVGRLDVALIPSIEVLRDPEFVVVSDACIACRGPVLSVRLLSRVPVRNIRSISWDEGSRTSVALLRILLQQRYGLSPEWFPLPIGADYEASPADAILLIGDRAIHPARRSFLEQWDLGEHWWSWTGLPFVFAMWVARSGLCASRVEVALRQARDAGLQNLEQIAQENAAPNGLTADACLCYLRDHLHFYLGVNERRGFRLFGRLAGQLGLVPPEPSSGKSDLCFHGSPSA